MWLPFGKARAISTLTTTVSLLFPKAAPVGASLSRHCDREASGQDWSLGTLSGWDEKVLASPGKHKAMSYGRMCEAQQISWRQKLAAPS